MLLLHMLLGFSSLAERPRAVGAPEKTTTKNKQVKKVSV
jgi:hypothetical protein